jgi:hypothetical protein
MMAPVCLKSLGVNKDVVNSVAVLLSELEGKAFQDAVCRELAHAYSDFQSVPDLSGDGGVDGLTHGNTRAYLCYGPNLLLREKKKVNREITTNIVNKYRQDFQRIFSLGVSGKGKARKLVDDPNEKLPRVLGSTIKLKNLYLVLSYFQDNSIIGTLRDAFNEYRAASNVAHVEKDIEFSIWGPADVATQCAVDESSLHRLKYPAFHAAIGPALTAAVPPKDTSKFDKKFDWLANHPAARKEHIESLRRDLRDAWAKAIVIDEKLSTTAPSAHQLLAAIRQEANTLATEESIRPAEQPANVLDKIQKARSFLKSELETKLDFIGADKIPRLSQGETAKLIGECYLDWT